MQNTGLTPVNNYIMYDVLPHIGDTGVSQALQGTGRLSEFTAFLTGPVVQQSTNTATFVIEYSQDPNYNGCRTEMSDNADETTDWQGGCVNDWVLAGAIADFTTVTSFRIRQTAGQISVGETLVFTSPDANYSLYRTFRHQRCRNRRNCVE